jgi:hypothetical protein
MGIAMSLELTESVGYSGSQIAPPEASSFKHETAQRHCFSDNRDPARVYELAVRYQVALKDEPGCETLNDYIVSAIDSATEEDERIHQLKARRFVR